MSIKQELMSEFPKGAQPPSGYVDWFEWAQAQHWHGLRQTQCLGCGLYKFPQEPHVACANSAEGKDGSHG